MYLHSTALKVASVATLTAVTGLANAGGFALIEHGASGLGNAYAGSAAVAADTSTLWFNPAGMLQLTDREFMVAAHAISSNVSIENQGTTLNTALGGTPVSGGATAENNSVTLVPNLYYVAPLNEDFAYGIALDVPFGSGSDYGNTWFGRYVATESSLRVIDINPSIAYRVSDKVHLGAGISLQQMNAVLANAVDSGAVCFSVSPDPAGCVNVGLTPGNQATDSAAEINGDSTAFGFNLGAMFIPAEHTRIGVAYRHSVKHELEGTGTFDNSPQFQGLLDASGSPFFQTGPGSTEVTTPANLSLSVAHTLQQNNKFQLLADVTWTQWSVFEELLIQFESVQPDVLQVQDWNDVVRVSAGLNYQHSSKLTLRAGLAIDQSPIPGPTRRTPRIPGNDRTWFSVGLGYKQSDTLSFDFGFTHIAIDETPIDNSFPEAGPSATFARGLIESDANIISAQLNWKIK